MKIMIPSKKNSWTYTNNAGSQFDSIGCKETFMKKLRKQYYILMMVRKIKSSYMHERIKILLQFNYW